MIAVAVADQHVFDVRRVEADLLHAGDDFVLDRIVEQRVDDDDAGGGGDGPRRELRLAEPVEVVEDPHRFGMPLVARWRGSRRCGRSLATLAGRSLATLAGR